MADDPFNLLSTAMTSIDPALLSLPSSTTFSSTLFYPSTSPPSATQSALTSPTDPSFSLDISPPNRARSQPPETAPSFQIPPPSRIHNPNPPTRLRHPRNDHARYHPYSRPQPPKEPRKQAPTSAPRPSQGLLISHSDTPQLRRPPSPYPPNTTELTPHTYRPPSPFLNVPNTTQPSHPIPADPASPNSIFTHHQNTTTLALGLQSHLSRLQHACAEMLSFLAQGFHTSDNDTTDINACIEIENQRLRSRTHNRTLTELHEPFSPLPSSSSPSPTTLPKTGLDIRRLDHNAMHNLLDHYNLPFSPAMFLHEKKALYLRFLGAGRALMHRVLD